MEAAGLHPRALQNRPELGPVEEELQRAFNILGSRRTGEFGKNPIQLSEIRSYVELFGSPQMPMWMFVELLGRMDKALRNLADGNKSSS